MYGITVPIVGGRRTGGRKKDTAIALSRVNSYTVTTTLKLTQARGLFRKDCAGNIKKTATDPKRIDVCFRLSAVFRILLT